MADFADSSGEVTSLSIMQLSRYAESGPKYMLRTEAKCSLDYGFEPVFVIFELVAACNIGSCVRFLVSKYAFSIPQSSYLIGLLGMECICVFA